MAAADNIMVKIEAKASDLVGACIKALVEDGTLVEVVRCKDCKHRDPEDKMCDSGHFIALRKAESRSTYELLLRRRR